MNTYDVGDRVRVNNTFTALDGSLADPSPAPTLTVRTPGATTLTPTVTHDSTGVYHGDVDVDRPGEWTFRWVSTGTLVAAESGSFYVKRP